jgi:hypothetical protein
MWGSPSNHTPHSDFFSDEFTSIANSSTQPDAAHVLLHASDYSTFQRTDRLSWHLSHLNGALFTQQVFIKNNEILTE